MSTQAPFELRREHPSPGNCRRDLTRATVYEARRTLVLVRSDPGGEVTMCLPNLSEMDCDLGLAPGSGRNQRIVSTCESRFGGDPARLPPEVIDESAGRQARVKLAPWSAVIYTRNENA
jgi:hypothetical protein